MLPSPRVGGALSGALIRSIATASARVKRLGSSAPNADGRAPRPARRRHVEPRIHGSDELAAKLLPRVVEITHSAKRLSRSGETTLARSNHREMKVWREPLGLERFCVTSVTHSTDLLAGRDRVILLNHSLAQVRVHRVHAVTVIHDDGRAIRSPVVRGDRHDAGAYAQHGRTFGAVEIERAVLASAVARRIEAATGVSDGVGWPNLRRSTQ